MQFEYKDGLLAELLLAQRRPVFVLVRPSTDSMRPTHIMEGNLLYSKSTDVSVNLIQKNTVTETLE